MLNLMQRILTKLQIGVLGSLPLHRKCICIGYSKMFFSGIEKVEEKRESNFFHATSEKSRLSSKKTDLLSSQPTPSSHPHLLKPGEITSGITRNEYLSRRHCLMDLIYKRSIKSNHHILVFVGSPRRYMIDKIPYLFRQDTDLLYLSGCLEPDCVLVMHSIPGHMSNSHKSLMFTQPYDRSKELWDGPSTAPSDSSAVWGVDEGLPLTELSRYLSSIKSQLENPAIWYHMGTSPINADLHQIVNEWIVRGKSHILLSPKAQVHSLRFIKSKAEIKLMKETCRISGESIVAAMRSSKPYVSEHQLFTTVDYHCRMKGAEYLAYPPVVAGGSRSTIIHYINNNNIVQPKELVLMDAGSEYRGYSGDITRTWPVDGKFTGAQLDLYEAVLEVQNYVIQQCAQMLSINKLFALMCSKLGSVLQELLIIPKDLSPEQVSRAAFAFCPHHVSHYLGMDVHDCALVSRNEELRPGSIITVEPGVYINSRNKAVDPRYLGIGIRIEDDILIDDNGCVEVLSSACPKHPDELAQIIGSDVK